MKRITLTAFITGVVAICLGATPAMADLYPTAPIAFGTSGDNPPKSLQAVLNEITVSPSPSPGISTVITATDAIVDSLDSYWYVGSQGAATIVIEIAGYAGTNRFGLFGMGSPGSKVEVFSGSEGTGTNKTIAIDPFGNVKINDSDIGSIGGTAFGFYLQVPQTGSYWYSDTALNTDGMDHMVGYQGRDDTIRINGVDYLWDSRSFIFGWEDLAKTAPTSDRDYQDFVVFVQDISVVPVPGAVLLGFLGLGYAGMRLRKTV